MSDNQVSRIQGYVNNLSDLQQPNKEMMQLFYQRYFNVKRWLFIALEDYNAAYRYWALSEPSVTPSIVSRASILQENLNTIKGAYIAAIQSFSPAPSTFDDKFCFIKDHNALETFKKNKKLVWTISKQEPVFESLDRVRLDKVRVWLDGAKHKDSNGTIYISISTDGRYYDRLGSKEYQFVGEPVRRFFQYIPNDKLTTDEKIQLDGDVTEQFRDAYFRPTPFTTWIISLPDDNSNNQRVDLTNITQIRVEFAGSAIAS
ncbi:MAG: hypothetical protein EBE86_010755 [Hormoscilla sp. GUM202]|nr:hypothetical protein [Hormoscilla sp. GUM202]